ncbi:DOT1-domain-containing protein [Neoconidiobolus thromboides FSU 785]|nr:DOT1-domain-containing protein [Neoconidiobolus thromboides FSU 785]
MKRKSLNLRLEPDLEEYNSISDIISTVETIGKLAINKEDKEKILCSELGILRKLRRGENRKDGESFIDSIKEFNTLVREMRERNGFKKRDFPKYEILEHILFQTYARVASPDAHNLTNYEAFSNQVYGEINSNLVNEFVQLSGINKDSLFIDMGSGIGNVVLQVACQTGCRAHGIEIMEIPSALAKYQQIELRARMQMYLLPIPRIKFYRGDFLTHPDILRQLSEVDVLLVNNYVFDSELNVKIMELFLKLKEGCKIISLKNFAPLELKINNRNAGEPETILRVKKYDYGSDSVSWTANAGSFFIHTVDRKPLNRFLQSLGE